MRVILRCLLFGAVAASAQPTPISQTRSTLEEWVLTEKTISGEREAWAEEKATMADLIRLLGAESEQLQERQAEALSVTTQAEAHRGELLEAREQLRQASVALEQKLAEYEAALRQLSPQLPTPLWEKVQPLLRRLPAEGKPSNLSAGQRAQNIVGVLGEIDKFNREVTLGTQIQKLPDGRSVEVRVLWFGLGSAYYADVVGRNAGILQPGPEGWAPVSKPELAETINRVIAQYERNQPAAFVSLPIEIQ